MDYILDYIKNIIYFVIFMTFIEILLPKNTYKEYLNLVLGLILVLIMSTPLINLLKSKEPLSFNVFNNESESLSLDYDEKNTDDLVLNLFKENIKNQILSLVGSENISEINVHTKSSINDKNPIESIDIAIIFEKNQDLLSKKEKNMNIKKQISSFYNLSINNINILNT